MTGTQASTEAATNPVNEYHKQLQAKLSNEAILNGFRRSRRLGKSGWGK